jgi:hypothetical protein
VRFARHPRPHPSGLRAVASRPGCRHTSLDSGRGDRLPAAAGERGCRRDVAGQRDVGVDRRATPKPRGRLGGPTAAIRRCRLLPAAPDHPDDDPPGAPTWSLEGRPKTPTPRPPPGPPGPSSSPRTSAHHQTEQRNASPLTAWVKRRRFGESPAGAMPKPAWGNRSRLGRGRGGAGPGPPGAWLERPQAAVGRRRRGLEHPDAGRIPIRA